MPRRRIVHFDSRGELAFSKQVDICFSTELPEFSRVLTSDLNQLKKRLSALASKYPVVSLPGEDNCTKGTIADIGCRNAVVELVSGIFTVMKKSEPYFRKFEGEIAHFKQELPELFEDYKAHRELLKSAYHHFDNLSSECKEFVNTENCFRARFHYDQAFKVHSVLLKNTREWQRTVSGHISDLTQLFSLTEFSEKLVAFVNLVHEYVYAVCQEEELLCMIRQIHVPGFKCEGHHHNAVKKAYAGMVMYYERLPCPADLLQKIRPIVNGLGILHNVAVEAEEELVYYYEYALFPMQQSLHRKIRAKEASLGEGSLID